MTTEPWHTFKSGNNVNISNKLPIRRKTQRKNSLAPNDITCTLTLLVIVNGRQKSGLKDTGRERSEYPQTREQKLRWIWTKLWEIWSWTSKGKWRLILYMLPMYLFILALTACLCLLHVNFWSIITPRKLESLDLSLLQLWKLLCQKGSLFYDC